MSNPKEISQALKRVHQASKKNKAPILRSEQILREDRELLLRTHWLQEIIKGWYLLIRPDALPGDSTVWYASFWDFLRLYLENIYDYNFCLSAESSLKLLLGDSIIPSQVVVIAKKAGGVTQTLPFETSVLVYADPDNIPTETTKVRGLQVMTLPYAICRLTPGFFRDNPEEAQVALQSIQNPEDLLEVIIKYKFKRPAARLASAYHFLGNSSLAQAIEQVLADEGVRVSEDNPFKIQPNIIFSSRIISPYYGRVLTLWNSMRESVIQHFDSPGPLSKNPDKVLDKLYVQDAFHSLSIEGYVVDEDLIEKVKNGEWNPETDLEDKRERNALAARGYFEAHQEVKNTLKSILKGKNPGDAFADDLSKWHYALFNPSVQAGILERKDLYGYRKGPVYIRNARHVPPPREALLDSMDALFTCLRKEENAAVRALLGHYIFVYIHPYIDGNGRLARFLMNVMLVSGGYPWTIIHVKDRQKYMQSLSAVDLDKNILPLTQLILKSRSG